MNGYIKRRGFTLVELLIVIVVIGILSAMMMLSSKEAVSSAKAAKIISDLTNLKKAALAFYMDNLDAIEGRGTLPSGKAFTTLNDCSADVLKYLGTVKITGNYAFSDASNPSGYENIKDEAERNAKITAKAKDAWFVWWQCDKTKDMDVIKKLAKRGQAVKLRFSNSTNDWQPSQAIFDESKLSNDYILIGLFIRGKYGYVNSKNDYAGDL